jgi:hypothetical protein
VASFLLRSAGNWLFCFRRWRDPRDSEDLEALEREYARLCSSFPRFAAACSKDRFISCIAGICTTWSAKSRDEPPKSPLQESGDALSTPPHSPPTLPTKRLPPKNFAAAAVAEAGAAAAPAAAAGGALELDEPPARPMPAASDTDDAFEDVSMLWEPCVCGPSWADADAAFDGELEIVHALRAEIAGALRGEARARRAAHRPRS